MRLRYSLVLAAASLVLAGPAHAADSTPGRAAVSLEHVDDAPQPFRLSSPRPNPFTSSTRLELSVDESTELTVAVYDALGRRVALLHDGSIRPGTYSLRVEAADLPPGLYVVRASDGRGATTSRSIALVR